MWFLICNIHVPVGYLVKCQIFWWFLAVSRHISCLCSFPPSTLTVFSTLIGFTCACWPSLISFSPSVFQFGILFSVYLFFSLYFHLDFFLFTLFLSRSDFYNTLRAFVSLQISLNWTNSVCRVCAWVPKSCSQCFPHKRGCVLHNSKATQSDSSTRPLSFQLTLTTKYMKTKQSVAPLFYISPPTQTASHRRRLY